MVRCFFTQAQQGGQGLFQPVARQLQLGLGQADRQAGAGGAFKGLAQ